MQFMYMRDTAHFERVMTAADDAVYNALDMVTVTRQWKRPRYLVCFFYVTMNVRKHIPHMTKAKKSIVKDSIYDMNFAQDEAKFSMRCSEAIVVWNVNTIYF